MKVKVTKNQVILEEGYIVNRGEYNANPLEFEFSEEYTEDLVKKAVFVNGSTKIEVAILNDTCNIPNEVLNEKDFELRVYAYEVQDDELVLRYSPTFATVFTREGSYTEGGTTPEVITPSQFEQYMQAMNDGLEEVENVDIDAVKSGTSTRVTITNRDGEEKTVYILDGARGPQGEPGTTNYTGMTNKPKINNVELDGNKTNEDLNIQEKLTSGTNIKTINNQSILGSGNITIQGGGGEVSPIVSGSILEFPQESNVRVENEEVIF